jgi:hypothetical protein
MDYQVALTIAWGLLKVFLGTLVLIVPVEFFVHLIIKNDKKR